MGVISFLQVLRELPFAGGEPRNLVGSIQALDVLLRPESLAKLQEFYSGAYAFLAFHPMLDRPVVEYIRSGALSSDSGQGTLVLFLSVDELGLLKADQQVNLGIGITLDASVHPAYSFVRRVLDTGRTPVLPGVLFFDALIQRKAAVYVPFPKLGSAQEVGAFLRSLFQISDICFLGTEINEQRFDEFCERLRAEKIAYDRSGSTSFGEWVVGAYQIALEHKADIVTVVRKVSGFV